MPNDLTATIEKETVTTETVGITLKELSLLAAGTETAGVLTLVLAPLDENGKWRTDVKDVLVRIEDKITPDKDADGNDIPIPQSERYAATMFHQLMFTAIVTDTPEHQAMGVAGLSVWDAAKVLAPSYLPAA